MTMGSVSHIGEAKKDLVKYVHRLAIFGVRLEDSLIGHFLVHNNESSLVAEVNLKQYLDKSLMDLKESILGKLNNAYSLGEMVF